MYGAIDFVFLKFKDYDGLIKYLTRYVARSVMNESWIIDYDGTYVTFLCRRCKDDKIVIERIYTF